MIGEMAQGVGSLLASDMVMVLLSLMLGILLGMLWSGHALPRPLPRWMRRESLMRRH